DGPGGAAGGGGTRPAGVRGDDGNRQCVSDIRRDGNIGGSSCSSDRRPRSIPLIGEGGWIVRPSPVGRGERVADLGGSRDGRNRRICGDDVDDGTRGRTGRGGTRPAGIRGDDGNRQRVA